MSKKQNMMTSALRKKRKKKGKDDGKFPFAPMPVWPGKKPVDPKS